MPWKNKDKQKAHDRRYDKEHKDAKNLNSKKWREANPQKWFAHVIKHKFGLDLKTYQNMLLKQHGACAICGNNFDENKSGKSGPYIDHNHETGKVRGLLCHSCNFGIGQFKDDPVILNNAINYLREV